MRFGNSQTVERTLDADNPLDLSKAQPTANFSALNFEESTKSFWATLDRVLFKRPMEVIKAILEAQGYVVNLENILACLDHFCFGVRAKIQVQKDAEQVKQYTPVITFSMPRKKTVGPLLQMFYDEIAGYELELAKLQTQQSKEYDKKLMAKSEVELRREVVSLRFENEQLSMRVQELATKLERSKNQLSQQIDQYGDEQILPDDMRLAKVSGVYVDERNIALRAGRTTFHFPMVKAHHLPKRGDNCIAAIVNGIVQDVFFYESMEQSFEKRLAQVLFVNEEGCKLRDRERYQWVLKPRNQTEQDILRNLQRGHEVIISIYQNQIIKVQPVLKINEQKFTDSVQEAVIVRQLNQTMLHAEALEVDDEESLKEVS